MYPLGKASRLLVLDEINKKEETQPKLDFTQIVFGKPLPNTKPEYDRNTELLVTSITSEIEGAPVNVYYNRLDMQLLFTNSQIMEVELGRPDPFTSVLQLLPELNALYGLAIDSTDVADAEPVEGDIQTLTALSDSYAWLGTLQIHLTAEAPEFPDLGEIITVNVLDGLKYPDADITGIVKPTGHQGELVGPISTGGKFSIRPDIEVPHTWQYSNGELQTAITVAGGVAAGQYVNPQPDYKHYVLGAAPEGAVVVGGVYVPLIGAGNVEDSVDGKYIVEFYIRQPNSVDDSVKRYRILSDDFGNHTVVDAVTMQPASEVQVQSEHSGTRVQFAFEVIESGNYEVGIVAYRRNSIVARVANIVSFEVTV